MEKLAYLPKTTLGDWLDPILHAAARPDERGTDGKVIALFGSLWIVQSAGVGRSQVSTESSPRFEPVALTMNYAQRRIYSPGPVGPTRAQRSGLGVSVDKTRRRFPTQRLV